MGNRQRGGGPAATQRPGETVGLMSKGQTGVDEDAKWHLDDHPDKAALMMALNIRVTPRVERLVPKENHRELEVPFARVASSARSRSRAAGNEQKRIDWAEDRFQALWRLIPHTEANRKLVNDMFIEELDKFNLAWELERSGFMTELDKKGQKAKPKADAS